MYSAVSIVEPPSEEPVTVGVARKHCRIDYIDDDDLLGDIYIPTARQMAEQYLGKVLLTQTLLWVTAHNEPHTAPWPMVPLTAPILVPPLWFTPGMLGRQAIPLPFPPLQSVESVMIGKWGEDDITLSADEYDIDAIQQPGRIRLRPRQVTWPQDHMAVRFVAGYGDTPDKVPQPIRTGILWLVAHLYENRGDVPAELPKPARALLDPYRMVTFGA